jgi:sec-independent protein translocase protein TatC
MGSRLGGPSRGGARGRGGVAAPAAAMNAEQRARAARRAKAEAEAAPAPPAKPAAATMNPEQRARAARRAKMAKQQTARQRDEVAAPTPQKKAPEPEPVVAMSVEARARASRRRKMEELAAAAPVATAAKAEAAAASKASSSTTAQAASAPEGDAPYKSSLFDDGAFEEALKGVNDVAAGLETASGGGGPSIDWGGVASVRSLGEDDPFPGVGDLEPATATVASTPKTVEAAMASSAADGFVPAPAAPRPVPALAAAAPPPERQTEQVRSFLYPGEDQLPDDVNMTIWEHLEELRDRALVSAGACAVAILLCFCFAKDLVIFLEQPVIDQVKFLQLGPGEYFFTTVKVAGYCGLLLGAPVVLYEAIAYVVPGLTRDERKFLAPIVLGSSVLFYAGIGFAYAILTPAALKFFIGYSNEAVESLWSIDQYFEFVLVLLFSTGLSFQVPVIQLLLGQTGLVSSAQMLSIWRYVVVGSVVAAAVLTPSTDPFTQMLLAVPLMSLYLGGAALVGVVEKGRGVNQIEG